MMISYKFEYIFYKKKMQVKLCLKGNFTNFELSVQRLFNNIFLSVGNTPLDAVVQSTE